jgi:hypothetical protein
MPTIRIVNPKRSSPRRRANRRRSSTKQNPLGGELLLMTNPSKRRSSRRNAGHRRRNPVLGHRRHHRRHGREQNPRIRRHHNRRRNPTIAGIDLKELGIVSVGAAIGGIATRGLTQMLLGSKNTGATGYAGNAAVALALTFGGAKLGGRTLGLGIGAGAIAGILLRVWQDQVSGTGANGMSGLGDLDFEGLGEFVPTAFPVPTVSQAVGPYQVVTAPPYGVGLPAPAPALPAKGATGHPAAAGSTSTPVARLAPRHAAA